MNFDNTYARELEGAFAPWQPAQAPRPRELFFNDDLARELGGELASWPLEQREAVFSGNTVPEGAQPIAQAYAGHQFGGFSPQLGDGRALLLGEVIDVRGQRRDIALKGSGRTPFSRGGDGKAAVGPMLREVLIGEALHALGIPSTRALVVVATGDVLHRERSLPGAVLTRVADSHLRVGTFEFFAARGDTARLQRLLDYAVARHAPVAAQAQDPALALLDHVCRKQAALVAQWMGVGFIHGVMNTDNMSISGQSIDFGPCAFMEAHDPSTVYSSIDRQGRYAYGNQPAIAQWNLARLADALWPVMQGSDEDKLKGAQDLIQGFESRFDEAMTDVWCRKLGWGKGSTPAHRSLAKELAEQWQDLMHMNQVDHTLGWRSLLAAYQGQPDAAAARFGEGASAARQWLSRWRSATQSAGLATDEECLRQSNPLVIPRNHQVEAALSAASDAGDLGPFQRLLEAVRRPFDDDEALQAYADPAPPDVAAGHRTFCGT
jgi:uncharacterized protein YdiU (UPF0061 family)